LLWDFGDTLWALTLYGYSTAGPFRASVAECLSWDETASNVTAASTAYDDELYGND